MPDPDTTLDDLISAVIVPVLPSAVFGILGTPDLGRDARWPAGRASLLWCGSCDALVAHHPRLPQAVGPDDERYGHGCADLIVETDAEGRLERVDFELHSLPETFEHLGDEVSAARARALYGRPAREAAYGLAALLEVAFEAGRTPDVT